MKAQYCFSLFCAAGIVTPLVALGETSALYTLSGVPGLEAGAEAATTGDFSVMINSVFKMAIGLGSLAAVVMIVFEGMRYAASAIPGVKESLRQRIIMIIGGLVLLASAYMLLEFINPRLVNIQTTDTSVDGSSPEEIKTFDSLDSSLPSVLPF